MKRKDPETLLIAYPSNRAKPGTKSKARAVAIAAGHKSFYWYCPKHGMSVFSTSGSGTCRCCIADAQRASKNHRNAAARVRSAEKRKVAQAVVAEASQLRDAYLKAMAAK